MADDHEGVPEGYELVWSDEFDGDGLDLETWAYRADAKHQSVQRRENVEVADGVLTLHLTVLDEPIQGKHYAGAGIVTRERFHYGYYEVRARFGDGRDDDGDSQVDEGWHHAFWAMYAEPDGPDGSITTTYPDARRTEIDCYENADPDYAHFTQHIIIWRPNGQEAGRRPVPPADHVRPRETDPDYDPSEFNTYAYEWNEDEVRFYVNGELTVIGEYPVEDWTHDELNLWLTAIAANWCDRDPEQSIAVYDYVRAYRLVEGE